MASVDTDGRPKRTIRKSFKAQESQSEIPGIDSSPQFVGPEVSPGAPLPRLPTPSSSQPKQASYRATAMSKRKREATPSCPMTTTERSLSEVALTQLSEMKIYFWDYPYPTNFLKLSEARKAWKAEDDKRGHAADDEDKVFLDQWEEFVVEGSDPEEAVARSVAYTFISRAKRAFRNRVSWNDFEAKEVTAYSMTAAQTERDPKKRSELMSMALGNDLRLAVFDGLKVCLCREVWLEEYPNFIEMPQADNKRTKKDSVFDDHIPTPGAAAGEPAAPVIRSAWRLQQVNDAETNRLPYDNAWWRSPEQRRGSGTGEGLKLRVRPDLDFETSDEEEG